MENEDGVSTASTDTSLFLRELQALNAEGGTGPVSVHQSVQSNNLELTASGDVADSQTLTQAMETIIGDQRPGQIINLAENVDESSVSVYRSEVEIYAAPTSGSFVERSSGSNKVKITPVVNHVWELRYYYGNLVAVHRDSVFVAYALRGKSGGVVRVISRKTAHRVLLKCFCGNVMDISFALSDDVYLAAVDETGSLFVHSLVMEGDMIMSNLIIHIEKETYNIESDFRNMTRVIWCPYMPEEDNDDDCDLAKMLVLLHGTQAEVWNVDLVAKDMESSGPVSSKSIETGIMVIEPYEPLMPVVNAAFAPDGSAIAVAYHSGMVKFFLVDLDGENNGKECMYDWNPHDGHPVTSLFFLDDHKHLNSDVPLWKFALTGAKYNTEIKIWSCETWACVQTINLSPPISQPNLSLRLKSEIDLTSRYLALSDIDSRFLYVLQIHQDYSKSTAHVSSVSQFSLAQPCVSFAIFDAGVKKFQHTANDSHLDEITTGEVDQNKDEDEEGGSNGLDGEDKLTTGVQIKMYGVHTRTLQELLIRYRLETSAPPLHTPSISSISQDEAGLRDMLSDMSMDQSEAANDLSTNVPFDSSQHVLMTPQAFATSSPSAPKASNNLQGEATHLSTSSTSSFTQVTAMNDDLMAFDSVHSSVDPSSVLSPSSAYLLTPLQAKQSPGGNSSLSEFPLPPITSSEVDELASPKNNVASSNVSGDRALTLNASLNSSSRSNQEILEEMFSGTQQIPEVPSGLGHSIDSSSSTGSFPVGSLISTYSHQERYDENDKEVAEALGESADEETKEEAEEIKTLESQEEKKGVVWPEPPDVSTEAKRLADETIEQITNEENEETDVVFYDDENDDAEVEEAIQHRGDDDGDDEDDEDAVVIEYPERPGRQELRSTPVHVLTNLDANIASLAEQLRQQQVMMNRMHQELNQQRELQLQFHQQQQLQQMSTQQPSLEKDIQKLEDILVSRMEHSLAQHMNRETQRLQDTLKKSDAQRKQRDDTLHASLLKEISHSVKDTVGGTLRTEVKQTVNPALHRFVEPMKEKIHQEVAHRLTACDTLLKENISKAVKSRSTMDVLATSVGDVIYQQMQQAYTDTFKTVMLPSFKATMEKTVRDVNGVFQQGTKEYQLYMRQNVDQMVRERGAAEDIVGRIVEVEQQFVQNVGQLKTLVINSVKEELGGQVAHAMNSLKEDLLSNVQKIVKEEITTALQEQGVNISDKLTSYLRSGAATPVSLTSEEDINKEKIWRELKSGRINDAFQTALSAGNLELVVYVCESASPLNIFSQVPFPLSQPVLLSLISQLSASLDKNFDLKMKFLEEAVMNLDVSQPMTLEHIPNVLGGLVQNLRVTSAHGNDPWKLKNIKLLMMAANSLLTL